ncbi:phenylalanine--tRNA ligase subunit beta [Dyadobacter fermentans]|uniref:Phenylalanine--tRNA ligase beta subunit n=1 Tax=Dyadobacter fermentans (strain ATCC 700827 / DSM 18053 / CIP 107007 / KCTC 52180 / NS114) TaxID=471854 RepID=C6VUH3_DYAFD|nr:phenylalanine--tRNA ligase subunit beta [Dyadobacter fermentans]ACT91282.1 phenylalanyl-tRNA synthetase, beta subunit [Dyadobacter fermentans DSM 18053]
MKISYKWLKDLIELNESPAEIDRLLTGTGLEVEGIEEIESIKGGLQGVVIGEVLTREKHPEADRLSLTTVDVGGETPLSIVCGAPNVAAGQKVIVATVGATLYPTGSDQPLVLKKSKIRGALSEGMICAEDELGVGTSHDGILVLDTDLPNGTPAAEYFGISSDYLIEIGLTPNRADAASHYGVARDLKAVLKREITLPSIEAFKTDNQNLPIPVEVRNTEACPRYTGLTISGITVTESPEWLKQRLQTIGIRAINNIVDITNYVCHELGQPMHAFDADKVLGKKVIVTTVAEGTPFVTLDGIERKISANDLMICSEGVDGNPEPMCIAGVFGGLTSGVTETTTSIFLESAYFSPVWVRRTAQRFALKTDSSFRFERGTDPNMPLFALKRAALLIQKVAGGSISSDIIDLYPEPIADFKVNIKNRNIDRLIGKSLEKDLIKSILESLDIQVTDETETGFTAIVPPYRVDVQREADVIEEILRIYGFGQVELSDALSSDYISDFPVNDPEKLKLRVSELLVGNGFNEMINNSLTKPEYQAILGESLAGTPVKILNYLSEDLSVMRQTLLFSGLEVIAYNSNRRQKDLKVFEFGKTYHEIDGKFIEKERLSVFVTGNITQESWFEKSREVVFHDLAAFVNQVLTSMKIRDVQKQEADSAVFKSGLTLLANKKPVVSFGLLNAAVAKKLDIKAPVYYADFDWEYLLRQYNAAVEYAEVPKFPEVRRDLSVVLNKKVTFEELRQAAFKTERSLLRAVNVFDVYEGANLEGKKSYSISFILQDEQQTLTDKVIDKTMQRLIATYEREFEAVIRK